MSWQFASLLCADGQHEVLLMLERCTGCLTLLSWLRVLPLSPSFASLSLALPQLFTSHTGIKTLYIFLKILNICPILCTLGMFIQTIAPECVFPQFRDNEELTHSLGGPDPSYSSAVVLLPERPCFMGTGLSPPTRGGSSLGPTAVRLPASFPLPAMFFSLVKSLRAQLSGFSSFSVHSNLSSLKYVPHQLLVT